MRAHLDQKKAEEQADFVKTSKTDKETDKVVPDFKIMFESLDRSQLRTIMDTLLDVMFKK